MSLPVMLVAIKNRAIWVIWSYREYTKRKNKSLADTSKSIERPVSVIFRYIKPKPSKIQTLPSIANRRSEAQERGKPHSVDVRPPIHVRGRPLLHKVAVGASDYGAAVDLR